MSDYCPDCGCRRSGGICSNCQEELYILTYQAEYITEPLSEEFINKAEDQEIYLDNQKRSEKNEHG